MISKTIEHVELTPNAVNIKTYFLSIRDLLKSGDQFPVDLDLVWPLVYGTKGNAVAALKKKYEENADYQVFMMSPNNSNGGRKTEQYKLSVPCMEHLIAREVREVFNVYREVFHQTVTAMENAQPFNPATISRKEMAMMILQAEERNEQLALENTVLATEVEHLSERNEELDKEVTGLEKVVVSQAKKVAYVDEVLTAKNCHTTTQIAAGLGMSAIGLNKLLKKLNVQYKHRDQWILKHPYGDKGYNRSETHTYENSKGEICTSDQTVWTELGRAFVVKKVRDYRDNLANDTVLATHGSQETIANNPPTA